jgi:hypothetical protein
LEEYFRVITNNIRGGPQMILAIDIHVLGRSPAIFCVINRIWPKSKKHMKKCPPSLAIKEM